MIITMLISDLSLSHNTHNDSFTVYIEAVVSGMFGAGNAGLINPPDPNRSLTVSQADIAVFDEDVYELLMDLTVLIEQAKVTMIRIVFN